MLRHAGFPGKTSVGYGDGARQSLVGRYSTDEPFRKFGPLAGGAV